MVPASKVGLLAPWAGVALMVWWLLELCSSGGAEQVAHRGKNCELGARFELRERERPRKLPNAFVAFVSLMHAKGVRALRDSRLPLGCHLRGSEI